MGGIKRCDATLEKVRKFYLDNGYLPEFYNPYNNIEVKDIAPTLTANCDRITNSATVLIFENQPKGSDNLTDLIKHIGVGHHPFSKKYEFKGYFDEPVPCLIATDYKAPKTVLELHYEDGCDIYEEYSKGSDNLTKINEELFEAKPFKYVSLFSGIGGFEQALNKLGGTCVLASEIDKFANQAYEALYGEPTAGDITKIDAKDVPDHDLLVGGFPCQSFSVAGKRLGFEDTRGTLFFEVARIAAEKKPKVVLLENVKGLVGHDKGRTLDTIVKTLNDIGYTVDFEVLNSKYFGVPQNRERIFIVAVRDDLVTHEPWVIEGNTVVPKGKRRIIEYEGVKTFNFDWPEQTEVTTRLRDILETEVDEKYYLDEEKTARLVAELNDGAGLGKDGELGTLVNGENISPTIDASYAKGLRPSDVAKNRNRRPMYTEPKMLGHVDIKGLDAIKRVYSVGPTLTTMGGGHREPKIAEEQYDDTYNEYSWEDEFRIRREEAQEIRPVLTPERMEKRQNGRRFKEDGEESFTLTAQDKHGVAIGQAPKYRIRKLTPKECFRLQGFTDEAHDAVKNAGISDSQRYKMAGNAVSVPVISAIGKRLLPYISVSSTEK